MIIVAIKRTQSALNITVTIKNNTVRAHHHRNNKKNTERVKLHCNNQNLQRAR